MIENPFQETNYVVYHAYPIKHIFNKNMDVFTIYNMYKIK